MRFTLPSGEIYFCCVGNDVNGNCDGVLLSSVVVLRPIGTSYFSLSISDKVLEEIVDSPSVFGTSKHMLCQVRNTWLLEGTIESPNKRLCSGKKLPVMISFYKADYICTGTLFSIEWSFNSTSIPSVSMISGFTSSSFGSILLLKNEVKYS